MELLANVPWKLRNRPRARSLGLGGTTPEVAFAIEVEEGEGVFVMVMVAELVLAVFCGLVGDEDKVGLVLGLL